MGAYAKHRSSLVVGVISVVLVGLLLVSCTSNVPPPIPTTPPPPTATSPASTATPAPLQTLKVNPEKGLVGTSITVTAERLPSGKPVEFLWVTVDGSYTTKVSSETIEFYDRNFVSKRMPLRSAVTDAQGRVTATMVVPEDYGEVHDIIAVVDKQDVAKGGFSVTRNVTISPLSGPVGTLITIEVKGLGWTTFGNTMAVLYDHKYAGFISAVTTKGTAKAQIRAAGPVGLHEIRVTAASAAVPYLNIEQSPIRLLGQFGFVFNVTDDAGAPPLTVNWPDSKYVGADDSLPITTASNIKVAPGLELKLSPSSGPILSQTTLQASGLPPGVAVDLYWVSAKGNRLSPSGWNLTQTNIGKVTAASNGSLRRDIQIPDDLGGWHVVKLAQGERVLTEVPYYVERSLVGVTPNRVKAGETFKIQLKGIGWTELDNTVAVTYDNAYIGYACGFNSQGDVTIYLQATGGPGTHLIDLYPTIFKGHGLGPWNYNVPQLTWAQDHPGLALGYRLPIFRLAIEVVP